MTNYTPTEQTIVIPVDELPEVLYHGGIHYSVGSEDFDIGAAEEAWTIAREFIAVARAIEQHSLADETQVQALASAVSAADARFGMDSEPAEDYARELYSRGVRMSTEDKTLY